MAKRKKFQYAKAFRSIKKFTRFDYTGIRESQLSAGQKSAIRRAFNDVQTVKSRGAQIVPIRRNPRESDRHYRQRIQDIHRNIGQSQLAIKGVAIKEMSPGDRVSFRGRNVTVVNPDTGEIRIFLETKNREVAFNTREEAIRIFREAKRRGAKSVSFMHGLTRGFEEFEDEESFADAMEEIVQGYPRAIQAGKAQFVFASIMAKKPGKSKRRKGAKRGAKKKNRRRSRL